MKSLRRSTSSRPSHEVDVIFLNKRRIKVGNIEIPLDVNLHQAKNDLRIKSLRMIHEKTKETMSSFNAEIEPSRAIRSTDINSVLVKKNEDGLVDWCPDCENLQEEVQRLTYVCQRFEEKSILRQTSITIENELKIRVFSHFVEVAEQNKFIRQCEKNYEDHTHVLARISLKRVLEMMKDIDRPRFLIDVKLTEEKLVDLMNGLKKMKEGFSRYAHMTETSDGEKVNITYCNNLLEKYLQTETEKVLIKYQLKRIKSQRQQGEDLLKNF